MRQAYLSSALLAVSLLTPPLASAQLMSTCVENSPERRGESGCSIIASKVLPEGLREPIYWHIDRFDSGERARGAETPASVAFEAAGAWWLTTIEAQTADHHGGHHGTEVGPLPLPQAQQYKLQVQSSAFKPGMYSLVHHHSGVEAVYVLEGEACFETPTRAAKLRMGETLAIPAGVPMRAVATGSTLRRVMSIIVHDAALPATTRIHDGTGQELVACK